MSVRLGIIGYPIRHSVSPIFQQAALDFYSLDATYQAWEVEPQGLSCFMKGLRAPDTLGTNVTVPHKESVIPYLDHIDDWAKAAGAVNTIVNEGGKLSGHNTDGPGFLRALEEDGGFSPEGRSALIIGAGGSAKAVALALAQRGVAAITIANRTLERAQGLVEVIARHASRGHGPNRPTLVAIPLEPQSEILVKAAAESHLIVNCTTVGMKHGPAERDGPLAAWLIPAGVLVYDLVYNPPETPLLREAAKAGAATLGGLPMLVYQGAASFELWTGKAAPVEVMMKAAKGALS